MVNGERKIVNSLSLVVYEKQKSFSVKIIYMSNTNNCLLITDNWKKYVINYTNSSSSPPWFLD